MEEQSPSAFAQFLDCLDSMAVIIASGVAIWGINAWKREHVGRRRIELAEQTLALFYEAAEVINATRSALGQSGDSQLLEQWASDGGADPGEPVQAPLLALRVSRKQRKLFAEVRALRFRFEAVFGQKAAQPFNDLLAVRREICDAEYEFLLMQNNAARSAQDETRTKELIGIMYGGRNSSDPTTRRVSSIVEGIEKVCRPVVESYGRTLTVAAVMRARLALGALQSQAWFGRLRGIWTRSPHRTSRSGHATPPSDSSAP